MDRRERCGNSNQAATELDPSILDAAVEGVHVPEEADDELRGRVVEDLVGRPGLLDPAVPHHDDPIRDLEGLFLIVRHEDGRDANLLVEAPQPCPEFLAYLRVERTEGLVQEEDLELDR